MSRFTTNFAFALGFICFVYVFIFSFFHLYNFGMYSCIAGFVCFLISAWTDPEN